MRYRDREELERWVVDARMRRRNIHPREAHRVLVLAGFGRRFGQGDHWVYRRSETALLVIDPRVPLLPAYASAVISAIEQILKEDAGDAPDAR